MTAQLGACQAFQEHEQGLAYPLFARIGRQWLRVPQGPVAERSQGPWPASRTCCPPTSLPLQGRVSWASLLSPQKEEHVTDPRCLLAKFPLSGPFSLFFYSKGKVLWFRGEGSRSWFFQIWQGLLARFPMGGLVWFLGLLAATHSWRSTSLSRGLGKGHVSPPPCGPRRRSPGALMTCLPALSLCPENSAASLQDLCGSPQPDLRGLCILIISLSPS